MASTPRTNESDELEKIMSEIEQLQSEISAPPQGGGEMLLNTSLTAEEEDILKEIQGGALSSEFANDPSVPADMQGNMEETLAQLGEIEAASSILDQVEDQAEAEQSAVAKAATVSDIKVSKCEEGAPMSNPINGNDNNVKNAGDGCLTLTLTGNMTLKLKYEFEGQEVVVSFADQALRVQMSDGTEFKVPVARLAATTGNVKSLRKTG